MALGVDLRVHRQVLVGPSLRAFVVPFDRGRSFIPRRGTAFDIQVGVEAAAGITVLIGDED
jgi:hypothetical protein